MTDTNGAPVQTGQQVATPFGLGTVLRTGRTPVSVVLTWLEDGQAVVVRAEYVRIEPEVTIEGRAGLPLRVLISKHAWHCETIAHANWQRHRPTDSQPDFADPHEGACRRIIEPGSAYVEWRGHIEMRTAFGSVRYCASCAARRFRLRGLDELVITDAGLQLTEGYPLGRGADRTSIQPGQHREQQPQDGRRGTEWPSEGYSLGTRVRPGTENDPAWWPTREH